ncbi:MAG: hypothetical protein H6834_17345 [Planctomycetes bacterium]|nr:hypothetical protein [Planctomycetota bacterium]
MEFKICDEALERIPHLSVDGLAPLGPNLSHWPGNRTPRHLAHELSTGICLRYVSACNEGVDAFADDCFEPIVSNTHYDTDGALSLFAILQPDLALEHARALLDAASCGDFLRFTTEDALALDTLIDAFHDPDLTPFASVRSTCGLERDEIAYREVLERLPGWLANGLDHPELWRAHVESIVLEIDRLRRDLREPGRSTASGLCWGETSFQPRRHAWNHVLPADRSLRIMKDEHGATSYSFEYSTRSWFDLPGHPVHPRVDLAPIAAELNALEDGPGTWIHDPISFPLPVLYCGEASPPSFGERTTFLRASSLSKERVLETLERHLRASTEPLGASP